MIIKQYVKDFEKLEFGMFVHFGLYSTIGRGEWSRHLCNIPAEEYEALTAKFDPAPDWAEKLARTAKSAGCKYITLTTRHHDGFSLYDNSPLNTFDAPHARCGRDLVREFVDACRAEGLVPFFYHTLLDWREPTYQSDFKAYLEYLRESIEILCTRYGKIGGFWFDGMWNKWDEDWEEDALYGLIRRYQPEAMIINNTGMGKRGELGHIELDSVTFERGKPEPVNFEGAPKYIASEMCQIFGDHWGYAALDYNFKSLADIIKDYLVCRKCGSNFLLNVGPMGDGLLRPLDTAMLTTLGDWITRFSEACVGTERCDVKVESSSDEDFVLKGDGCYYLFCHNLKMVGAADVVINEDQIADFTVKLGIKEPVKSVSFLDNGKPLDYKKEGDTLTVLTSPQPYGQSVVVRIAKIVVE
ncbi:MAG: alpha-L-fucosidase [Clostridia bacterium]|nr:alpha-L-fucosidase [Clostridia bacterium]